MGKRIVFIIIAGCIAISAIVFSACSGSSAANNNNAAAEPAVVDINTAQAVVKPIPAYIEATGNLASDAQTDVAPAIAGKVVEVNFDIGSYVNKGDVLIRLDPRDAAIKLDQARSQVVQYQQQYKETVAKAKLQAKQAADATAKTVSRGALFGSLALMLGALAAFGAGKASAVNPTVTGARHFG